MSDVPLCVMMVEDDDADHALLVNACRNRQVPCVIDRYRTGTLGWEALIGARDAGRLPGLVILDIALPGIAGFDLLNNIRSDDDLAALPVMMLTGSVVTDDRQYRAAADHYFVKPQVSDDWAAITCLIATYAARSRQPIVEPAMAPIKRKMPQLLHIEDEPDDRFLFSMAFACSGLRGTLHQVVSASDALAFLCRQGDYHDAPTPDLIILDLGLPGEGGSSFLATMRGDARFRSIPVIILTGSESYDDVQHCRDLLVIDYVIKPRTSQQLSEFIGTFRQWLSSSMSGIMGPKGP